MNVKKIICAAIFVAGCALAANADVQPNALGLRFTGGWLFGAEINYQSAKWALFGSDRLEIGVGWGGGSWEEDHGWHDDGWNWHRNRFERTENWIGVSGVTQWHWNISPTAARGGFNWYLGPGASVGFTFRDAKRIRGDGGSPRSEWTDNNLYLGVGGQIGIEYDFNVLGAPLNLSIDTRPMIDVINLDGVSVGGIINGATLGLRWTF